MVRDAAAAAGVSDPAALGELLAAAGENREAIEQFAASLTDEQRDALVAAGARFAAGDDPTDLLATLPPGFSLPEGVDLPTELSRPSSSPGSPAGPLADRVPSNLSIPDGATEIGGAAVRAFAPGLAATADLLGGFWPGGGGRARAGTRRRFAPPRRRASPAPPPRRDDCAPVGLCRRGCGEWCDATFPATLPPRRPSTCRPGISWSAGCDTYSFRERPPVSVVAPAVASAGAALLTPAEVDAARSAMLRVRDGLASVHLRSGGVAGSGDGGAGRPRSSVAGRPAGAGEDGTGEGARGAAGPGPSPGAVHAGPAAGRHRGIRRFCRKTPTDAAGGWSSAPVRCSPICCWPTRSTGRRRRRSPRCSKRCRNAA